MNNQRERDDMRDVGIDGEHKGAIKQGAGNEGNGAGKRKRAGNQGNDQRGTRPGEADPGQPVGGRQGGGRQNDDQADGTKRP